MSIKNCPYCGEEILSTAKKCKHCDEWLEEKTDTDISNASENESNDNVQEKKESIGERVGIFLILSLIGRALFYFGSWNLVLGEKINAFFQFLIYGNHQKDFILESKGIVFRINEGYWGFAQDGRFFDSPIIQWIMLFLSLGAFFYALRGLILGFGSDD
jgi:hypothetical protein